MNWEIEKHEKVWFRKGDINIFKELSLVVILRIRNEEEIIKDTLDHIATFADYICIYDDASTDNTLEILKSHEKVFLIIENKKWKKGISNRLLSETRHRGLLLNLANKYLKFKWCMCCDADERYIGDIREYVTSNTSHPDLFGIRIQLFDAYMTHGDDHSYEKGMPLLNFRNKFGPECRNILMLWKNDPQVCYQGLDAREPSGVLNMEIKFHCQHYGKSLSYKHWQETCDYYVKNFPWDPYGMKWSARQGQALHTKSDFGNDLYDWGESLFINSITEF